MEWSQPSHHQAEPGGNRSSASLKDTQSSSPMMRSSLYPHQQVSQQLCRENLGPSQMGTTRPHMSAPHSRSLSQLMGTKLTELKASQLSLQAWGPPTLPQQAGQGVGCS